MTRLTDPGRAKRSDGEPQDVRIAGVQQDQSGREGDGDVCLGYQRGSKLTQASMGTHQWRNKDAVVGMRRTSGLLGRSANSMKDRRDWTVLCRETIAHLVEKVEPEGRVFRRLVRVSDTHCGTSRGLSGWVWR